MKSLFFLTSIISFSCWGAITHEQFHRAIEQVTDIYAPELANQGITLITDRRWEDKTHNAYSVKMGKTWRITLLGGLAEHETMSEESFAMVVCTEIGHIIAGAPYRNSGTEVEHPYSVHSQVDYFVASKCLKRYLKKRNYLGTFPDNPIDPALRAICNMAQPDVLSKKICEQTARAGSELANFFASVRGRRIGSVDLFTPDPLLATETISSHSYPQCRLDTYFAGALCDVDPELPPGNDINTGYCTRENGYRIGVRPLCWFKP